MHHRLAKEFARIESKYPNPLSEEEIYEYLKDFSKIVPQGSPMSGIGHPFVTQSVSNCCVIDGPEDNLSSIADTSKELANLYKNRFGVGFDLSKLRPQGAFVNNSAKASTGAWSFAEWYSTVTNIIGQCIAKGERVLTQQGLKPIEEISSQDKVWTKKGWVSVLEIKQNGTKKVVRVTTQAGYSICLTPEHKVLTLGANGLIEIEIGQLGPGDSIVLIPGKPNLNKTEVSLTRESYQIKDYDNKSNRINKESSLPETLTPGLAYILGYSYGDGYIDHDKFDEPHSLQLACSNDWPRIKENLVALIKQELNHPATIAPGDGRLEKISIYSKRILADLEINKLLKQKSKDLIFPKKILESPPEVQASFIAGYFDADGYASGQKKGYVFASICLSFLKEVQQVLMSLGIASKIHSEDRASLGWNTLYSLTIIGAQAQERAVRLIPSIKIKSKGFSALRDCWLTPWRAKDFSLKYNNYNFIPDNSQFLSANALERVRKEQPNLPELCLQDEIISFEYLEEPTETYDLILEKEHLFYCEGFYVHNSGRRGALMLTLSIKHPDALHFSKMKLDETKVTGANVSLRITDEFMTAVENNSTFTQQWPIDSQEPKVTQVINARELWNEIVDCAQKRGDPGLLMWDNITRNLPSEFYKGFESLSTNPCSEIPMCVDTCRLITQNLLGFVRKPFTKQAAFDAEAFKKSTQVAMRLSDDLVDIEIEQLEKLIAKYESENDLSSAKSMTRLLDNAKAARRTGLGLHALGDTLASLGIQYDSPEGIAFTEEIYRLHAAAAYQTSIALGDERGVPSIFMDGVQDENCEFLQRLEASKLVHVLGQYRRNVALLTTAPTGTVSLMSAARLFKLGQGGSSSGIESILWLSCNRYKKLPHTSNEKPDRVDLMGVKWKQFDCLHPAHQYWLSLPKEDRVDESVFRTVKDIDPLVKVQLVAAAQRWVDHGISCTINCPKGTTKEQVHEIYLQAWKQGMKGITVFVEGSRQTAVLETKGIKEHHAPKRPKELPCDIHRRKIDGEYWTVLVGLYEGRPYEIFAGKSDDISIGASIKNGTLVKSKKEGKSQYDLHFLVRGKEQIIQDIVSVFDNDLYADQSRLASMSLRHGVPLEFIAEQLEKSASSISDNEFSGSAIIARDYKMDRFSLVMARVIKSYIPDGTKALSNTICKDCGNASMVFQDGCYKCSACGSGRCS